MAKKTTDHDTIRRWVEERGGWPASVIGTGNDDPGLVRIDFPGYSGDDTLERIDWDVFFQKFEAKRLAFVYEDQMRHGELSNFNKLVSRDDT